MIGILALDGFIHLIPNLADALLVKEVTHIDTTAVGGSSISTQQVEHGGYVDPLPQPTKSKDTEHKKRFEFEGWYQNDSLTGDKFTTTTPVNSDITLYANYTETNYNVVTFNTNGGSSIGNKDVDEGQAVAKPNDPYKDEKFFAGWYESPSFEGSTFDFSTIINSNKTLYAKWVDIPIEDAGQFVKVTRNEDVIDGGKYLFVYGDGNKAFNGGLGTLDAVSNTINVVFDGDSIIRDSNTKSAYFVIDKTNGFIKSASSYYIGMTAYENHLRTARSPSENYLNGISFDGEGNVLVQDR